jgi:hypothetical protein
MHIADRYIAGLPRTRPAQQTLNRRQAKTSIWTPSTRPFWRLDGIIDPAHINRDIVIPGLTRNPVPLRRTWIPAFAGMTDKSCRINRSIQLLEQLGKAPPKDADHY